MKRFNTPETIIKTVEDHPVAGKLAVIYWDKIGSEITELVKNVDRKPKIYQNDYGHYLALLTSLKESGLSYQISSYLLIKAGGNYLGIIDAYKILVGG